MRQRKVLVSLIVVIVIGIGGIFLSRSSRQRELRALEFEGKAGAKALCSAVSEFHQSRGVWIQAGPAPRTIPDPAGIAFPQVKEFQQLGFDPGRVRFQYEVRGDGEGRECIARGDPDGDGVVAVFTAQAR